MRNSNSAWEETETLDVDCPYCGVKAGRLCQNGHDGSHRVSSHPERHRALQAQRAATVRQSADCNQLARAI